jgi:hypothetical protein
MDTFTKIKKLNIPLGKYIVIGGTSLEARGIRKANDIDLLVLPDEFERLRGKRFEEKLYPDGNVTLVGNGFEIGTRFIVNYEPSAVDVIKRAEIINGVPFTSLNEEIKFKKAMGREKDLKDIKLIEKYLQDNI